MIASTLLAAIVFLAPPNPGGLPFPVPTFPKFPAGTTPEIELAPMEHSEGYAARVTEIEAQINAVNQAIDVPESSASALWSEIPAMDGSDDFETGIEIIDDDYGGIVAMATLWGEQLLTLLIYGKAVSSLAISPAGQFYSVLLISSMWLMFVRFVCLALALIDFLMSGWVKLRQSIPLVGYFFGG